jgi:hypothetical protein
VVALAVEVIRSYHTLMAFPEVSAPALFGGAALSKSRYMQGLQCPKLLWHVANAPEEIGQPDAASQATFDQGCEVGALARAMFPDGVLIESLDREVALSETHSALARRVPIFEADFQAGAGFTRIDILVPVDGGAWDALEVKSSTEAKEVHLNDLAFQAHVLAEAGIKVRKLWLVLINSAYIRDGEIRPNELFAHVNVTDDVRARPGSVGRRLREMIRDVANPVAPLRAIGAHCNDPYPCPLVDRCWSYLPPRNVTSLYRGAAKGFDLLTQGVVRLAEIADEDALTENQRIQRRVALENRPHVDRDQIAAFLGRLAYPLHYLDFETFSTAIPLVVGVRPYEQVPFQFSLHVVSHDGAPSQHHDFLADGESDPRPAFLARLRTVIGGKGSVIVYNQAFELARLRECQAVYPEYADLAANIESRIIDLLEPFRSFAYYHGDQEGSCSIKAVMPALVGQSYKDLAIQDGGAASREFVRVTFSAVEADDRNRTRTALRAYCGQDTLGMVRIVERLHSLIGAPVEDESIQDACDR